MNDRTITQVLALSAALLLLCLAFPVNSHALVPSASGTQVMDGVSLPLPIKGTSSQIANSILVTDGVPLPPPIKGSTSQVTSLVTDGVPLPPPIKGTSSQITGLVTDGVPLPPPIKG